jgi:hypothetical protein
MGYHGITVLGLTISRHNAPAGGLSQRTSKPER